MAKVKTPTRAQRELIEYFAGQRAARDVGRTTTWTYAACERHGWIKKTESFPFHATTAKGLAVL